MHRFLAASLLLLSPQVYAQDATFRANPAHTGVYEAPGASTFHKIKWQFHTRGQILSSPAVAGNTVYFGSNDHHLYALDLESGAEKWKFKTEGRVASSPAVSNGLVYFLSYDSNFYALDAATGARKWISSSSIFIGCIVVITLAAMLVTLRARSAPASSPRPESPA
jgi:outer membrane protein assembly factor BamB